MDVPSNTNQAVNGVQRNHNAVRLGSMNATQWRASNAIERAAGALAEHMQANAPTAVGQAVELQHVRQEKFCQVMSLLLHKAFNSMDDKLVVLNQFDVALASYSELAAFSRATRLGSIDLLPTPEKLTTCIRLVAPNHPISQKKIARQLLARLVDYLIEPVGRRIAQGQDVDAQDLRKTANTAIALLNSVNSAAPGEPMITHTGLDTDQLAQLCTVLDGISHAQPAQHQLAAQAAQFLSHLTDKINYMTTEKPDFDQMLPNFLADYDVMLAAVLRDGSLLEFASRMLRNDRDLVCAAVRHDGMALEFAAVSLQNDREVVWAAVTGDSASEELFGTEWNSLQFASPALRDDFDVVLAAVRNNGSALEVASNRLQDNRDVVMAAVRQDGLALEFASPRFQGDDEVVLTAIENDPFALEFADERLRNHPDFWYAAALM